MPERFYDDQEAQEILNLAVRSSAETGFSQARLIQTAAELGVSEQAVMQAVEELERRKSEDLSARESERDRQEFRRSRLRDVREQVGSWLGTSAFLAGLDYFTSGFHSLAGSWCIWPIGLWGLMVLSESVQVLVNPAGSDEEFAEWSGNRRAKEAFEPGQLEECVRQAVEESGPGGKHRAVRLVRERTGLGRQEARRAVRAYWRR